MWDYVLVASCFLVLIAIKFYLFKVSYDKKMKYFTDPNELAIEFISNQKKMNTEQQQHVLLENLHKLADHNMRQLAEAFATLKLSLVSERLRNIALIIAVYEYLHKKEEKVKEAKLKQVASFIYPNFTIFTKINEYCNQNKDNKKLDLDLLKSIQAYIEYTTNAIGQYIKSN